MSEPKLISPLLDGFSVGSAVSEHDGVRCYPALKENSEKKYIVKIISIPASQVQLDALLLTGAYSRPDAAMEYFKELAENVEKEAAALKSLSRVEGFLAFEGWQVVPMEGRLGYEVYLLSSYRHSLEAYIRRHSMTHLAAVNLGIDICTALSAARRAGWIYADLKPSNIYISGIREYRIGDLGLMELDSLDLAALPGKYRSAYTAPELADDMLSPNTTMDTYALGLILYQIYNNGRLPQVEHPTEEILPPPENADYEMAEIILKACAPSPAQRWEDPVQMGQALVAYLQRNVIDDSPILPPKADISIETTALEDRAPRRDETLPGMNDDQELNQEDISSEVTEMIAQADDLLSLTPPAPPVVPEGASLEELEADLLTPMGGMQPLEPETLADEAEAESCEDPEETAEPKVLPVIPEQKSEKKSSKKAKKKRVDTNLDKQRRRARFKSFLITTLVVLIIGALLTGGYLFYTRYYIQMISGLSVTGSEDEMTVQLDTRIDNDLLTVICTDNYGNTKHQPVINGTASFTDLLPDMVYKIRVEIEGFHRLDGSTTHEYMTPAETRIASYTAATGPEDGTAILNFTVDGPDSDEWTVICTTEGEEPIQETFTGHMITVNGLTVGKTYTMRLEPTTQLYIPGGNTLEFTASSIIVAEDLQIVTNGQDALTVTWKAPADTIVASWHVRCYNAFGYDQSITTDQLTVEFDSIDFSHAYTVEVVAEGMTQPARTGITANPIYITGVQVDDSEAQKLKVSWSYEGNAPEGGWLLLYTIDGNGQPQVVQCTDNFGVIEVRVPNATYDLTIQAANGSTVFHNTHSYTTPGADMYQNEDQALFRRINAHLFFVDLFRTPEKAGWHHNDVHKDMFTDTFASGESISVQMYYMDNFFIRHEDIAVMYVIRDENGKVLADSIAMENLDWRDDLWNGPNYHYCCMTIPNLPTVPGKYTVEIYFDGRTMISEEFTITE